MKLSKAKEILLINLKELGLKMPPDYRNAVRLGVSAIERLEELRGYSMTQVDTRLPFETED